MKILLTGASGGIGSAIREALKEHTFVAQGEPEIDWIIYAHGVLDERHPAYMMNVNALTPMTDTLHHLPSLKQGVIYISSTAALKPTPDFPVYAASKAALNSYAQSMAKAHPELQFYAICPGPTDTKMWRSLNLEGTPQPPEAVANLVKEIVEGKWKGYDTLEIRDSQVKIWR